MVQQKVLSLIERDLIINLLASEHVVLHIVFTEKSRENVTFRVETGLEGVIVTREGVIRFMKTIPKLLSFEDKNAVVIFYFKKLGLTFTSRLEKPGEVFEILVPKTITRLSEEETAAGPAVQGRLFFSVSGTADVSISCVPLPGMPLFKYETWKYFSRENTESGMALAAAQTGARKGRLPGALLRALDRSGRLLYKNGPLPVDPPFPLDVCVLDHEWNTGTPENIKILVAVSKLESNLYMPIGSPPGSGAKNADSDYEGEGPVLTVGAGEVSAAKLEDLIAKTALCNYLTRMDIPEAAAGREGTAPVPDQHPLHLVYVNDKMALLGGITARFPLVRNQEYALQLVYRNGLLTRAIYTTCCVSEIHTEPGRKRSCALCLFTTLKAEDKRFLFETLYGSIFN